MTQVFHDCPEISLNCSTIVDVLRLRSSNQPNTTAFTFLEDGENQQATLTYHELEQRSMAIATQLQVLGLSGERALLLYSPGLDYLAAFFGCLYAGVVAVPAYPPRNRRNTPRIQAIVADAQASIVLTTTAIFSTVKSLLTQNIDLSTLQWLTTDNLEQRIEDNWQEPSIDIDTLAFLQYTSGSTGTPKGVMLSHGNLLHNAAVTYQLMEHSPSSKFVSWLPVYHDMGLIGGILQPLYGGFPCILMSPASFLQRPYLWLQAISKYKGTTSGGPNFAYEHCIQKITQQQRSCLDLSSWSVAFNGAEPIRHDTLEHFAATFAECGFRWEAFYPCYGMAEATLIVSGGIKTASPEIKPVLKSALSKNQVIEANVESEDIQTLISCGQSIPKQQIVIVNPETFIRCQASEVGEIWVSGPSVGQGYWHRQEETEQTFHADLKDTGEGSFLRTGDLGFLENGELFITGRAKDLIIIRGRNLYPQDIELTAERSHPSLRSGSGAAFAVEIDNEERLVLVQELEFRAKPNVEAVVTTIRQAVTQEHEVQVYAVVLIKPGSISKTSSGKIQRRATKADFLAGKLDVVQSSILKKADPVHKKNKLQRQTLLAMTLRESQPLLESYLMELLVEVLAIAVEEINLQQPLTSLGLDSLKVFELKNRIEDDLEVSVSISDFFEDLSIQAFSTKLLAELTTAATIPSLSVAQQQKTTSVHPLSCSQQQLWFIHQLASDIPAYNIPIAIDLKGELNVSILTKSLNEIIRRHQVLRTNFVVKQDKPVAAIKPPEPLSLSVEDLRELSEKQRTAAMPNIAADIASQPFDLSCQLLLRAKLVRWAEQEYKLFLTLHHIIADGWSVGILIRELATLYEAFEGGQPSPLPELSIQYTDFVYWQRQWLQSHRIHPLLTYWKQKLCGKLPVLNLPTDRPRSPVQTFKGARSRLVLPQTLTVGLKKFSQQEGVTLFMTLLTAFKTLLYRYTGQTDILVGTPIASRSRAEINPLIGLFVNILVFRTELDGKPSFRELLARVKSTALDAYVHQDLPFEKLVEEIQPQRDLSYNPLFQVVFVLQNLPQLIPSLSDIFITCQEGYNHTAKFDLTLYMEESPQGLVTTVEYNTNLFNGDTMTRMLGHFSTLLEATVANPDQCISEMPLLTAFEQQQLIVEWNNPNTDNIDHQCIHQVFEQQVERTPNAIALIFDNQQLTYRELNNQANRVAHYLQKLGVKPEVLVSICMERSPAMVIGLLAILKAGGAYLPLDPTYPKERLGFMLADAQASVVLTQQHLVKELPPCQAQVVCIDGDWEEDDHENPVSHVIANNLAYVIYTSGSTGKPKGVLIEHDNVVRLLSTTQAQFNFNTRDIWTLFHSIAFDFSVWEIWGALLYGGRLVIVPYWVSRSPEAFYNLLCTEQVSVLNQTPSAFRQLIAAEASINTDREIALRLVIFGGEALEIQSLKPYFERHGDQCPQLVNMYGITETTVHVTYHQLTVADLEQKCGSLIGRPIADLQVYILDKNQQPVPVGIMGEMYVGGAGLARGYLNQPELTAQRFITDFLSTQPGRRLYKTGDMIRYLPNGSLEYLGRIDHQVKIRGFRIELGEIEAALAKHPAVREVVAIAWEDKLGEKSIIAYVVFSHTSAPSISELRTHVLELLPEYMIPSAFVVLDALPLTPNGKVDRRALPDPQGLRPELTAAYEAPKSDIEQAIATVWQEVLHIEKVGVNDNFFDLGGNSLLIVQVNNKLRKLFNQDLSIVEIFQNPTISSLAGYLSENSQQQNIFLLTNNRTQKQIKALQYRQQLIHQHRKTNQ
ncbi:MAG: amino acid adenylation domain-containing protein [Nostoc sp.]|uniref:amino acid adenylation domain-containing protein n=1 Tax=Nostoc sp. TaxID=1180 RepID=UPI002FF253F3